MPAAAVTSAPLLGEPLPVEFMNTIWADRTGIHDALATDHDVHQWLKAVRPRLDLPDDEVNRWLDNPDTKELPDAAGRLRSLRNALRRLAAEQTSDPRQRASSSISDLDQALQVVNDCSAAGPHWNRLTWHPGVGATSQPQTAAAPGATLAALIAEQATSLFTGEAGAQMRACLAPGCVLYFVKQHARREWCSTACGNRARAARHYERHSGKRRTRG